LAAVAVFAVAVGGFFTGVGAFLIFAVTMGILIFTMVFLGASLGPTIAVPLRVWGRRVQALSTGLIILIGAALIYASTNPGILDRLVLSS